jgi:hypothetical protein
MIDNPHKILEDLKPQKEFFIGIDSDGCVFDTMEIKQKECFCPSSLNTSDCSVFQSMQEKHGNL